MTMPPVEAPHDVLVVFLAVPFQTVIGEMNELCAKVGDGVKGLGGVSWGC